MNVFDKKFVVVFYIFLSENCEKEIGLILLTYKYHFRDIFLL